MGRKPKFTRDELMTAALEIVDQQGLEALSMRRLAGALGVEAMSLYRQVSNKAALLDAVHEAVVCGMQVPQQTGQWLEDARQLALSFRGALCAHPNTLTLFATRPAVTAGSLRYVELALVILAEPFFDMKQRVQALQTLVTFVVGNTMSHYSMSDSSPDIEALPVAKFPMLSAASRVLGSYSADEEFEFGLDALLAGLQARALR